MSAQILAFSGGFEAVLQPAHGPVETRLLSVGQAEPASAAAVCCAVLCRQCVHPVGGYNRSITNVQQPGLFKADHAVYWARCLFHGVFWGALGQ